MTVVVADCDAHAASRGSGTEFIVAPCATDDAYLPWLTSLLDERDIGLAVSVNDHELSVWAHSRELDRFGRRVLRLRPETQSLVEDKLAMALALPDFGITSPRTWLASEMLINPPAMADGSRLLVKNRYGSGSAGVKETTTGEWAAAVADSTSAARNRRGEVVHGQSALDSLVVQEFVSGVEFGLDVVCDLKGEFASVLAREKHSMRHGETDQATTVEAAEFEPLARAIALAVPHAGLIDVDVLVDDDGCPWVIDVNPRFGGGYPFSHQAGADAPAAYLAWLTGRHVEPEWLSSQPGVRGAKFVSTAVVSSGWQ